MQSAHFFFEMKDECKVPSVKMTPWIIAVKEDIDVLFFYIFEYGAEYGVRCCA